MLNHNYIERKLPQDIIFIATVTAFYCGAIEINNHLLFFWLEDSPFRHWIYLPMGLKLFLIMLFGTRAFFGIALGIAVAMLSENLGISFIDALAIGMSSAVSILLSVKLFSYLTGVSYPWVKLKFYHLPMLAIFSVVFNSVVLYQLYRLTGLEDRLDWQNDILIEVTGRFLGTFIFIYLAVLLRNNLKIEALKL